jgi:hypothetical protein
MIQLSLQHKKNRCIRVFEDRWSIGLGGQHEDAIIAVGETLFGAIVDTIITCSEQLYLQWKSLYDTLQLSDAANAIDVDAAKQSKEAYEIVYRNSQVLKTNKNRLQKEEDCEAFYASIANLQRQW